MSSSTRLIIWSSTSVGGRSHTRSCRGAPAELAEKFVRVEPEAEIGDLVVANLEDLAEPERRLDAGRLELAVAAHVEIGRVRSGGDVVDFVDRVAAALDVLDRDATVGKRPDLGIHQVEIAVAAVAARAECR